MNIALMGAVAADPGIDLVAVRNWSPLLHAIVALALLVVATTLALVKHRGVTPYGR